MTPRNIKPSELKPSDWFSEQVFAQVQNQQHQFNVSGEKSPCHLTLPSLLKVEENFKNDLSHLDYKKHWNEWSISYFRTQDAELLNLNHALTYGGWPKDIHQFLEDRPDEAVLHFEHLGSVHLSRTVSHHVKNTSPELYEHLLSAWLDYALSAELWGPSGKWSRFHHRFHTLFEKYGLLVGKSTPGFYPLHSQANWLMDEGYLGKKTEQSFLFIPGWDFPLSALKKLETLVERRFACIS